MIRGIVSGKGGVGKTTIVVNLGLALHKLGENIVILDADLRNPNMSLHLGVFKFNLTLQDIIEKDISHVSLLNALYIHDTGMRFIPAHLSLSFLEIDSGKLRGFLRKSPYNLIIDSPPGLGRDSINVIECCDEIYVVAEPYLPDITDCMKTIEVAKGLGVKVGGIILNKVRGKEYELKKEEIEACANTKVIATIPFDEEVLRSLYFKNPVVNYNPLAKASINLFQLAAMLSGKEFVIPRFLRLRRAANFLKSKIRK
jgi:septum site-determining protein MinD